MTPLALRGVQAFACPTLSTSVGTRPCVFRRERMAPDAVRLARVDAPQAFPTALILSACDRFNMQRVDTAAVSAQVVQVQSNRDRTDQVFIGPSMGADVARRAIRPWLRCEQTEQTVALCRRTCPGPTGAKIRTLRRQSAKRNQRPKAFVGCLSFGQPTTAPRAIPLVWSRLRRRVESVATLARTKRFSCGHVGSVLHGVTECTTEMERAYRGEVE